VAGRIAESLVCTLLTGSSVSCVRVKRIGYVLGAPSSARMPPGADIMVCMIRGRGSSARAHVDHGRYRQGNRGHGVICLWINRRSSLCGCERRARGRARRLLSRWHNWRWPGREFGRYVPPDSARVLCVRQGLCVAGRIAESLVCTLLTGSSVSCVRVKRIGYVSGAPASARVPPGADIMVCMIRGRGPSARAHVDHGTTAQEIVDMV